MASNLAVVVNNTVLPTAPPTQNELTPELQARILAVQTEAAAEAVLPLVHGRLCIFGIVLLEVVRAAAWWQSIIPGYTVLGMHVLTTVSDVACLFFSVPLFTTGTRGRCVQLGCLGPMLTLVFAMSLVDVSALVAYLVVAAPRPLSPGARTLVDVMEANIGVWEFALLASVSLQVSLCISTWRIYKALRVVGLYPPDSDPKEVGNLREVSIMEVVCEAQDIELLRTCEVPSGCRAPACCAEYTLVSSEVPQASDNDIVAKNSVARDSADNLRV